MHCVFLPLPRLGLLTAVLGWRRILTGVRRLLIGGLSGICFLLGFAVFTAVLAGSRRRVAWSLLLLAGLLGVLLCGRLLSVSLRRSWRSHCRRSWLAGCLVALVADAPEKHNYDCNRTNRCSGNLPPSCPYFAGLRRCHQGQISKWILFERIHGSALKFTVPAPW